MNYVNKIRRIVSLQKALPRARAYADRHSDDITVDIDFRIEGRIDALQHELKCWWWVDTESDHEKRHIRHRQLRTACRLLGLDYFSALSGYRYCA